MGGIFDILSKAISLYDAVTLNKMYRMADFTKWGYCFAEAYNGKGNEFLSDFESNRDLQTNELVEGNNVIQAFFEYINFELLHNNDIRITSGDLYNRLSESPIAMKGSWIRSPKALTNILKEYKEIIEKNGYSINFDDRTSNNRYIHIKYKNQ